MSNYSLDDLNVMENPFLSFSSRERELIFKSYKYRKTSKKKMNSKTVFRTAENTNVETAISKFYDNFAELIGT